MTRVMKTPFDLGLGTLAILAWVGVVVAAWRLAVRPTAPPAAR